MKLTTKGRYAVTAMLDLALHQGKNAITLNEIAQRQELSHSYLEQLFGHLRKKHLVESVRGPGGGYRLAKPADEITIAAIIQAINEPVDVTLCAGAENCRKGERCITHDLWNNLNMVIFDFLDKKTLGQLIASQQSKSNEYYIAMTNLKSD